MSWNLLFCQLCFTLVFLLIFLTVYGVYAFADQYWCVLPVTLLWISWLRRLTRLDWRLSGCVPKVGRQLSRQCPSSLCITRLATWTGQWHVENSALDSNIIDTQLLSCTSGFTLFLKKIYYTSILQFCLFIIVDYSIALLNWHLKCIEEWRLRSAITSVPTKKTKTCKIGNTD